MYAISRSLERVQYKFINWPHKNPPLLFFPLRREEHASVFSLVVVQAAEKAKAQTRSFFVRDDTFNL